MGKLGGEVHWAVLNFDCRFEFSVLSDVCVWSAGLVSASVTLNRGRFGGGKSEIMRPLSYACEPAGRGFNVVSDNVVSD
jgi:hypothetical protein